MRRWRFISCAAPVGVRVTLLEPREVPGAGVAYSTTEPSHRINVPAARMQLAGEEEGAFDRWYRSQPAFADDPHALLADGAVYPQRGQFGRYVAQRFAEEARASGGRLTHLREQALSVNHGEVVTDGGRRLQADLLVLAISHPPPSLPSLATPFATHPALIANPRRAGVLATIAPEASVAVMGTGLTMADTVATLTRLGHRGPIAAFSRRGLLSRSNLSGSSEPRRRIRSRNAAPAAAANPSGYRARGGAGTGGRWCWTRCVIRGRASGRG